MKTAFLKRALPVLAITLILTSLGVFSLSCADDQTETTKLTVAVTILPQASFVKAVGGDKVETVVMVPPGADPHTYEVTPRQMTQLADAQIYAKVGSPIEFELAWLDKLLAVNQDMLVVDCSEGLGLIESQDPDEPGMDPHIWLSVRNAKVMVQNICDGLIQIDPDNRDYYEANCSAYLDQLTELDTDISQSLSGVENRSFIVFHPAFGYFARDYNLTQIGVEQEGKEPNADYLIRLIEEAKANNIHVIFISPEFNTKSAEVIADEIDGQVVIIDPLAEDYISNMLNIAAALKAAMH
ncbi:MAG: zinc ABC transporter substrate-binding protein [Dehalococcoides mccartyi]|uniref:Zinc ABC transporter substrate-binding protein n=1 Tax=Dehalococcoides mccartyi TaxID=61435 RepID=A0A0V8M5A4_9CHLR|nr:zinc ABC transporter substrate-binding protein [Dehalococcoides mccartyi]KSV18974.1 zinc ABC transporter substrate-binding protein [Dehalococcoides mccartyi]